MIEGTVPSRAGVVNQPGDDALAGAGFACDESVGVGARGLASGFENPLHRRALGDDLAWGCQRRHVAQANDFSTDLALAERALDSEHQGFDLERLGDEVARA